MEATLLCTIDRLRLSRTEPKRFCVSDAAFQSTWSPSWLPSRPGSCSSAVWDTGHPQMTTLMNLSAPCPVASIRSILLGNKCERPRPNTLPHSNTHTGSNTHFLRSVLLAASLISIGLTLLVQILFTWCGHPGTVLNLRSHNKSSKVFVLWSEKPQDSQLWVFVNMVCETLETARETRKDNSMTCGQTRCLIPK